MSHNSRAIANYFLDLGEKESIQITPMKLQKLVFYAHGWFLGLTGEPLLDEQVECWKFGPVISSLFHVFKNFGSQAITDRAYMLDDDFDLGAFSWDEVRFVKAELPAEAVKERQVIRHVWDSYKYYSGAQLSNMTHLKGTPWEQTMERWNGNPPKGTDIAQDLILEYFVKLKSKAREGVPAQ